MVQHIYFQKGFCICNVVVVVIYILSTRGCNISHYLRIDMTKLYILHDSFLVYMIVIFTFVFICFVLRFPEHYIIFICHTMNFKKDVINNLTQFVCHGN